MLSRAAPTTTDIRGGCNRGEDWREEADVKNNDDKQMLSFPIVCGNKVNVLMHLVQRKATF